MQSALPALSCFVFPACMQLIWLLDSPYNCFCNMLLLASLHCLKRDQIVTVVKACRLMRASDVSYMDLHVHHDQSDTT